MNINPLTGLPMMGQEPEEDPLLEFFAAASQMVRLQMMRDEIWHRIVTDIIPRLAIGREEMEINEIAMELLSWDQP